MPNDGGDGDEFSPLVGDCRTPPISSGIKRRLFMSHFLSTWNSRVFEFAAILFIAKIYPGTLLPASVYALVRAGSAVCLASAVGRYIDRTNRLQVARVSIGLHSHNAAAAAVAPRYKQSVVVFTGVQSAACTLVFLAICNTPNLHVFIQIVYRLSMPDKQIACTAVLLLPPSTVVG